MVVFEVENAEAWVVQDRPLLRQGSLFELLLMPHSFYSSDTLGGFELNLLAVRVLEPAHREDDSVLTVVATDTCELVAVSALYCEDLEHRDDCTLRLNFVFLHREIVCLEIRFFAFSKLKVPERKLSVVVHRDKLR